MTYQESPGNIRNQVGKCLLDIGMNIEQQDPVGVENFVRYLEALSKPILLKDQNGATEKLNEIRSRPDASSFENQMELVELILVCLSEKNLYAFKETEFMESDI